MIYTKDYSRIFPLTLEEIQKLVKKLKGNRKGCWVWTGNTTPAGYGKIRLRYEMWTVHRVTHELFIGPVPTGLVVHHECRNPRCCNPRHLEAVTQSVNIFRGNIGRGKTHYKRRATHCPHGHPLSGANLIWATGKGYKWRVCKACDRARKHRYYIEHKRPRKGVK